MALGIIPMGAGRRAALWSRMDCARHVVLLNATRDESDMYAWWLESSGYDVSIVRDIPAVCRLADAGLLDVLVIDAMYSHNGTSVRLPELLTALSHRRGFRIITLSGYPNRECSSLHSGDEICLGKPCLPPDLSERIEQMLSDPRRAPTAP